MASWFGWGSSTPTAEPSSSTSTSPELVLHGDGHDEPSSMNMQSAPMDFSAPVLALDQIKHAGVPINRQMSPYLQMDPKMFVSAQPQYIMPYEGATGKGKFEFALGHIGWAVGMGFGVGSMRGAFPEMLNPDTKKLTGKPWMTRIANATVKHGSGYAQPAGTIVFLYSALEIGLRQLRAEDELNSIAAGALAGAIYRSPHGARAIAIASGVGAVVAALFTLSSTDSRQRLSETILA